ncbi:hypothetical protein N7U66_18850 [Lacinutrix neustonica]|uniref:Uncharacterized protein n=1 Tax=Lacinutrix neustonica TaxID=2980107 RepID=A0A9E8SCZ7_9FLAO|nr:hypothetical protein [Lacinutrix neustonica]WAC01893.1 hypothetical protein N7U66_18850 [Lacinutrix neustonica]
MKTPFKLITKIAVICFALFLYNCESDNAIDHEKTSNKNKPSSYIKSKVTYEEVSKNTKLINQLETINQNDSDSASKMVFLSNYAFYVDTDESNYLESLDGTYHSYTFPIYKTNNRER